jgi:hypothetical protein
MDGRRKQFVRIMDETIKLMRQARSAGSLAPQRHLSETLLRMIEEAEVLKNDEAAWFHGRDARGRMMNESGQFIGGSDEG